MAKYLFGDLVREIKEKVDRQNNPYEFFVAGDHMDTDELHILRRGTFAGSDVGPAFIRVFKPGQVLYGSRRTYLRKVAVADFEGITANTTFVLETKDDNILAQRLLPFIMQSERFVQHSIKKSKGSTNPYVLFSDLCDYELELPDRKTQEKVADILWAMDATKKSYQKLIAATDELVKSQFIEMFGDPVSNEKDWPMVTLDRVAEIHIGPFGSMLHKEDYIEGGHALVNPSHIIDGQIVPDNKLTISDEKYNALSVYHLENGDIVLGRRGEMGRCAVVTRPGLLCGTGSMIIRAKGELQPFFLQKILSSPSYRAVIESKAVGVTMMNINVPIVSSLMIPLLPVPLQDEYIAFVRQSDKSKFELEKTLSELIATYKRIISENLG